MSDDEILYHYCSADTFLKVIEHGTLRLSNLGAANDHKEGTWFLDRFRGILERLEGVDNNSVYEFVSTLANDYAGFAFCMSAEGDKLSQWRGYADDGRGVAFGIKKSALEDMIEQSLGYLMCRLVGVQYEQRTMEKQASQAAKLYAAALKEFDAESKSASFSEFLASWGSALVASWSVMAEMYSFKNKAFEEEAEVRVVAMLPIPETYDDGNADYMRWKDNVKLIASDAGFVSYFDWDVSSYLSDVVTEVVLGPKNLTPLNQMKAWLNARDFEQAKILRSSASYR